MLFNSYIFIFLFLPITLWLFFTIAKRNRSYALGILFIASIIFYGWNDYRYVFILLFSIAVNFLIGKYILKITSPSRKKNLLVNGIIFNLGLLGYFKYADFFIRDFNVLLHTHLTLLNVTLPIGISFFTFTQLAFLIDCYRGLVPQYRLLNYGLFVTYFPHLIAGPIIHHKEVMPQFDKDRTYQPSSRNFLIGLTLFAIGLFKKVVLAEYLGHAVSFVFDSHLASIATLDAWSGALAYTLELYFDFSGYCDMALGLSLLIGVKLPVNFYSPYKALNIIDFWRRWNMTLSRFLRDYLYIPLGGNRKGPVRRYINLMLTMILGGLWHGASWTFVFWGCLHGIYLCINHAWIAVKGFLGVASTSSFLGRMVSRLLTFLAVVVAWVFFRADDFATAQSILHAMFFEKLTLPSAWCSENARMWLQKLHISFIPNLELGTNQKYLFLIFISLFIVWFLPNSYQLLSKYKPGLLSDEQSLSPRRAIFTWRPTLVWNFSMALLFFLGIAFVQTSSIFLYFRF